MNSGRMTFRFDEDSDKRLMNAADRQTVRGTGTALEYEGKEREENITSLHPRTDEYIIDLERVEPSRTAEVLYMNSAGPRHREPDDLNDDYDTGRHSFVRPGPVRDLWEQEAKPRIIPDYREGENGAGERHPLLDENRELETERYGEFTLHEHPYGGPYGGAYHSRRPSYWWKLALSIAGALGTGILLGYAALSFIGRGNPENGAGNTANQSGIVQNQTVTGDAASAGGSGLPAAAADEAAGHIPVRVEAQSYYLLQYGVFSTPAGASQAQQELLAAGLAAGLDPGDGNRVYAGMSPDREQAKLLSSGLKNQGIELYVREVALPALNEVSYAGKPEAVNTYFAASSKLLNELSSLSAALLSGSGAQPDTSAVSDLHMQWTQAVKALEPGLSPEGQSISSGLEKSMSQGISALNEYGKNKAEGLLWEVQEAMMSFLSGQKSLRGVMGQ